MMIFLCFAHRISRKPWMLAKMAPWNLQAAASAASLLKLDDSMSLWVDAAWLDGCWLDWSGWLGWAGHEISSDFIHFLNFQRFSNDFMRFHEISRICMDFISFQRISRHFIDFRVECRATCGDAVAPCGALWRRDPVPYRNICSMPAVCYHWFLHDFMRFDDFGEISWIS